ncbi:MAG TPA: DUF1549 domain-containing protein [Patescibacteria group bacterium]|nr:DUF1549 domain-containing protein [Patescibacteria group bacterium]
MRFAIVLLGLAATLPAQAKLTPAQVKLLPPAATRQVSFSNDIKPILEASCIKCHGRGRDKGNFRIDSRETLLKGGDSGSPVVIGKSDESLLIELVSGLDPDNVMPKKGSKLTKDQIALLRAWIDQGAKWDSEISFAKQPPRNLSPASANITVRGKANPIDAILEPYFKTNRIKSASPVSDAVFARRVYLDVIGLLPTPEELDGFIADKNADKRARLVQRLLADNQRYAEHWLTFWNDALRNDYRGTGYIDGGRKQITAWLFNALVRNMPYDKFVAELVNPTEASAGFSKGIVWRGVVNASQVPAMQAAQNISQVFMGVNLKCASCHDSFINDWTLADSYALANIYSDEPLEIFHCDKPTGRKAGLQFLYPELGDIPATTNKAARLQQLAQIITSPKNGRLPRTIVNRLWAKFFGRGLVEPVDDMESTAWNQVLLDWLAEDLVQNQYDLKKTIQRMLTSRAYQMPAVAAEQEARNFVFRGPTVRRVSAEQFRDALGMLTGVWYGNTAGDFDFSWLPNVKEFAAQLSGHWIWAEPDAAVKTPAGTVLFRKQLELEAPPTEALAVVTCDNKFILFVNGKEVASGKDYTRPQLVDLKPHLKKGTNVFGIRAVNNLPDNKSPDEDKPIPESAANPAGLYLSMRLNVNGTARNFQTDSSWVWSRQQTAGWEKASFDDHDWQPAHELGDAKAGPWKAELALAGAFATSTVRGHVRSALVAADPLMVSLGRPSREQVITCRSSAATTLQALELTNGETLAKVLQQGAAKLIANQPSPKELVTILYRKALGRTPSRQELELARNLVGEPVKKEGVEDLVWSLAMLPEFQLIY